MPLASRIYKYLCPGLCCNSYVSTTWNSKQLHENIHTHFPKLKHGYFTASIIGTLPSFRPF